MQSDQHFFPGTAVPPLAKQAGYGYMHLPSVPQFLGGKPPSPNHFMPAHGIEFQPSERCPKNLIIFDQTDQRRQIMFNPAMANKLAPPDFLATAIEQENFNTCVNHIEKGVTSGYMDDSHDIDILMNSDEEDYEEYEDDEVSTARTCGTYGSNYPDSFSTDGSKPCKNRLSSSAQKSSASSSSTSNIHRKRQNMKKKVNVLREIIPGGEQMSTVTVLDEAVKYLKSLKVEVQKLGLGNLND